VVSALARADELIKSLGRPAVAAARGESWRQLAVLVLIAGAIYGGFMGSFALRSPERLLMVLYAAVKVPILIFATGLVCLPGFFVVNSVLGLRNDFPLAVRAVLAGQAALTVSLASLGPITRLIYVSGASHRWALLTNAAMFTVATGVAQAIMLRRYRLLIAGNSMHRVTFWTWGILYAFVGIQMGWMLRPFVGNPGLRVTFLREEPLSNAYVVILRLITGS
jgi:hypothetical protein